MANWFASPAALWLGLLIGPLLLLYMLRHKPVRKRVPSIVLWTGAAQAQIATSPFQRLRKSLSLLLMLLALIALVLALAGFRLPGGEQRGVPLTIVVDTTASMGSFEPGGSRMTIAKERARETIEAAGNSSITLLAWDGNLRSVGAADSEPAAAAAALEQLEPAQYGASDSSLVRALEQLDTNSQRRVVLISDHAPGELSRAYFVQAGTPKLNAGFVSASLSEPRPGQVDLFFAADLNGTDQPVSTSVVLERVPLSGSIELIDARDIRLIPKVRNAITFENMPPGLYRATLKLDDGLMLDNTAYLRLSKLPVQDVVVTGTAPEALIRAIEAIEQTMGIVRQVPAGNEDQDVTSYVLGDAASSGTQPRLPSAYLAPTAAPPGITYGDLQEVPDSATRPATSYLWRGSGTPDIRIPKIFELGTSRYLRPVLDAGPGPAVSLVQRENELHDMVLTFPMDDTATGFTGKVAFLIFWANWFDHVRRQRDPLPRGSVDTRESVRVRPMVGRKEFRYGSTGSDDQAEGIPGRALHFDETGVYRFDGLDETDLPLVGVSLLDTKESNLGMADDAPHDLEALESWMAGFDDEGERRDLDLRPWLALFAAALLLFDWFWFRRKFPTQVSEPSSSPKTQTSVHRRTSQARS